MSGETIHPGQLVWYATGRYYVADDADSSICDAGFLLHLQGVQSPLRNRLTFLSEPFRAFHLHNGALKLGIDTVGQFGVYRQSEHHHATYDYPPSFGGSPEDCVATFERISMVVGTSVGSAVTLNTFSARLMTSRVFELDGVRYDFRKMLPHGITQWGTASPEPISPTPEGFTTVVPFVGSAVAY